MEKIKINKVSLIIFTVVIFVFLLNIGRRYASIIQYQGEWRQYDSREYSQADTFPDGFGLEYPANWEVSNLEKGGAKNLGELRVTFYKPNYLFTPSTGLQVWWRRVDDYWTLEETKDWYVEDVAFGVNNAELAQKQDSFREVKIGKDHYPALVQTFSRFEGENPLRQVILVAIGDETFAFSFFTNDYNEDVAETFARMKVSLEFYR